MNPSRLMVTVSYHTRVFVWNRRLTERHGMVKLQSEGDMNCDTWCWRLVLSKPPPGCLWWLWWSECTVTEPSPPDGISFCWCSATHQICYRLRFQNQLCMRYCRQFASQQHPEDNVETLENHFWFTSSKDSSFGSHTNKLHLLHGYGYPPSQQPIPDAPQFYHCSPFNITPSSQPSTSPSEGVLS